MKKKKVLARTWNYVYAKTLRLWYMQPNCIEWRKFLERVILKLVGV